MKIIEEFFVQSVTKDNSWKGFKMDDIKIPKVTFAFGDTRYRVLYGPENDKGERKMIGCIDEMYVEKVSSMLDFADTNMPLE